MPTLYPGALDALTNPTAADTLAAVPHDEQHANANDAIEALEAKVGTGASTPVTPGHVLKVTGVGATAYGAVTAADIEGAVGSIYLNVTDYGATGDGVTDDTAAIQAAITAASDNETVFLPTGHYIITSSLTVPEGVRLLGAGADPNWYNQSTIIEMTTLHTDAIRATTYEKDLGVESLTLLGPGAGTGRGIYSSSSVRLRSVHIEGFYDGVYVDDSLGVPPSSAFYNHIDRCWFTQNQRSGLLLHTKTNNTTVSETYFAFSQYGILADGGGYGLRVLTSSFEIHSVCGISIDGTGASQSTSGVLISGCYFEQLASGGSPTSDIEIGPTTEVRGALIEGCFFVQSDVTGLWHINLDHASSVTVSGNHIGSNAESGAVQATANTVNLTLLTNYATGSFSVPASAIVLSNLLSGTAHDSRDHTGVPGVPSSTSSGSLTGIHYVQEGAGTTIGTTATDIAGATLTITPTVSETWVVMADYDFNWTAQWAGNLGVGSVAFSGTGTKNIPDVVLNGDAIGRKTIAIVGTITGVDAAAHTIKLQALKTDANGTLVTEGVSRLVVVRFAA